MELAEPALGRPRRLAGMEERLGSSARRRLEAQRGVDLLDGPLRLGEAAVDDAGDVPVLLRQLGADAAVDARDLEQRDALDAGVGVPARRLEQARRRGRCEARPPRRERLGQAQVAVGDERRGVRLGVAGADERVLDEAAQPLPARQPPERRRRAAAA